MPNIKESIFGCQTILGRQFVTVFSHTCDTGATTINAVIDEMRVTYEASYAVKRWKNIAHLYTFRTVLLNLSFAAWMHQSIENQVVSTAINAVLKCVLIQLCPLVHASITITPNISFFYPSNEYSTTNFSSVLVMDTRIHSKVFKRM